MFWVDIHHVQVAVRLHDCESDQTVLKLGHEGLAIGAPRRPRAAVNVVGCPRKHLLLRVIQPGYDPDGLAKEIYQRIDVARSVVTNLEWRDIGQGSDQTWPPLAPERRCHDEPALSSPGSTARQLLCRPGPIP